MAVENEDVQDVKLNEVQATDAAEEEAGFAEAFGQSPVEQTADQQETEAEDATEPEAEAEEVEAAPEEEQEAAPAEEEPTPEAQAAEDQKHLKALLDSLPALDEKTKLSETQIRQLNGKIGEINRIVQELRANTAAPAQPMKLSKEKFKRLSVDFPEIAEMLAEDLSELSMPAAAPQTAAPQAETIQLQPIIDAEVAKVEQKLEAKLLTFMHRDWREVVKSDGFQAWVKTLPETEQTELANSWDAEYIGGKLTAYKALTQQQKQEREKRNERLARGVMPRSTVKVERGLTTEEEGFNSAF